MLDSLFESGAASARPRTGALVSVAAHTALIAAAVVATARTAPAVAKDERIIIVPLRPVAPSVASASKQPPSARRTVDAITRAIAAPPIDRLDFSRIRPDLPPVGIPLATPGGEELRADLPPAGGYHGSTPGPDEGGAYRAESVDAVAALLPPAPAPGYPEALRRAGVAGRVVVRFVVDTAGRVEMESIAILSSAHAALERAVRDVLPRYRFRPAEADGKRVRMLVELPFEFALR